MQELAESFIRDGFVKIENAFPLSLAEAVRKIIWRDAGCTPDPATWKAPVIRLGEYVQEPFIQAANTPILRQAFDQLVGKGRWAPRMSLGSFPVRFPHSEPPQDDGWHVDASFPGTNPNDYMSWRINMHSQGRALLMLFLFTDVSENDAPTRIRVGSHQDVARILEPFGSDGLAFLKLAQRAEHTDHCKEVLATGSTGTVYLCHPFLVHAAQAHHGKTPRIMAQPPLFAKEPITIQRPDGNYSPVELAIRQAIGLV
jgi:hypothetical protein